MEKVFGNHGQKLVELGKALIARFQGNYFSLVQQSYVLPYTIQISSQRLISRWKYQFSYDH